MTKADFQVAGISNEMENNYNYFITNKNSNYFWVVGIQVIGQSASCLEAKRSVLLVTVTQPCSDLALPLALTQNQPHGLLVSSKSPVGTQSHRSAATQWWLPWATLEAYSATRGSQPHIRLPGQPGQEPTLPTSEPKESAPPLQKGTHSPQGEPLEQSTLVTREKCPAGPRRTSPTLRPFFQYLET